LNRHIEKMLEERASGKGGQIKGEKDGK
jgi:hypothetical protein